MRNAGGGEGKKNAAPAVINTCKRRSMAGIVRGNAGFAVRKGEGREGYGSTCDCDCARGLTLSIERHKLVQGCSPVLGRATQGCWPKAEAAQLVFVATVASGVD